MLARHVSDLTGRSSGAFYKLYLQIWYVVIRVLLDTSSRYELYLQIWYVVIQFVKHAPDDGPVRSETCRANISDE